VPYNPEKYNSRRNCVSCLFLGIGGFIGWFSWEMALRISPAFTFLSYGIWLTSIILTIVIYIKDMKHEEQYLEMNTFILPDRIPEHSIQPDI